MTISALMSKVIIISLYIYYGLYKVYTVVWEKIVVGNIHEQNIHGKKNFVLAGYKPL